ncbi:MULTISPECIES: glycoside hydrolase family 15 [Actinomyces]|uniref:Glycoside hydrolase family 15 n=1 Tax=Actinomyces marmotae TaxID=2737173 RepID=A0A6M8B0A5_9ACTO|nr:MULTISPECIES: glycoside hydrolase family 15 [Actinomyces]QKD80359.1 glycoside hydrolase family 15 [Actinomyces marmotae]
MGDACAPDPAAPVEEPSCGTGTLRRRSAIALPLLAGGALAAIPAITRLTARPEPTLLSEGLAVGAGGLVRPLAPGASVDYLAGTRVPASSADPLALDDAARAAAHTAFQRRASGARLPRGRWRDLAADALADLLALTSPSLAVEPAPATDAAAPSAEAEGFPVGAVVAGPVGAWRYVWPRDASFAAVALDAVGLREEALAILRQLAALQLPDGGFEARYDAAGQVPDSRPRQEDGAGWFLWALGRVIAGGGAVPAGGGAPLNPADLGDLGDLADPAGRAAGRLMTLTSTPSHLPPAGPDYWEVPEKRTTLGLAAPVLLGLEGAVALAGSLLADRVGPVVGAPTGAPTTGSSPAIPSREALAQRVGQTRAAIEFSFNPGWGRHVRDDDVDAAIALVGPPFTRALAGSARARASARARMTRAAGGLAPGSGWRDDGVSWTPETALLAWSAAALGERTEAEELMTWLESHRTAAGALAEKVLSDGRPAGPAPLAWTCALVLLAAGELAG